MTIPRRPAKLKQSSVISVARGVRALFYCSAPGARAQAGFILKGACAARAHTRKSNFLGGRRRYFTTALGCQLVFVSLRGNIRASCSYGELFRAFFRVLSAAYVGAFPRWVRWIRVWLMFPCAAGRESDYSCLVMDWLNVWLAFH